MLLTFIVLFWLICGVIAYGVILGTFTRRFPWSRSAIMALLLAIFGPITLISSLIFAAGTGHFGFRLVPLTKEQRWEAHKRSFPELSRAYFEAED